MKKNSGGLILQSIRKAHGLSQYEMALKGKTFQANVSSIESGKTDPGISTLETFIAPLGYSLIAIPTTASSAARLSLAIAVAVSEKNFTRASRLCIQLNDNLMDSRPEVVSALCIEAPALTGDQRYDALIAGICEYRLALNKLPFPAWILESTRKLDSEWIVDKYEKDPIAIRSRTPIALQNHNVLMDETEFASV